MELNLPKDKLGLILKVGLYIFLVILGLFIFPFTMQLGGVFIAAAMGTFAAAAVANAVSLRIFERGRLADIGMNWHPGAARNMALGVAGGIGAACIVLVLPLLTGMARLYIRPTIPLILAACCLVTFILLFGAVGEETAVSRVWVSSPAWRARPVRDHLAGERAVRPGRICDNQNDRRLAF